ncbi:MAG: protease HtpX [Bdellovibrionaceae bacterium]|nr:protease HtpX [Pseudobdellovibrionaceae bacterium]|tara:strand:- start:10833 stop:11717 length:885 start_codon:yes stop_codon:yes gene_type:complete
MTFLKRAFFLILVNVVVVITFGIVFSILGAYFGVDTSSYQGLIIWCTLLGFGGSFFQLFASKWMAKTFHRVQIIDRNTRDPRLTWVVEKVYEHARRAGIKEMPEVGVYESPEINAFATGPSKNNSLVAVSSGILNAMDKDELEGVIAHEVAHVANGDMVTMTLIQGVMNTLVYLAAHIVSRMIASNDDRGGGATSFLAYYALLTVFGLLGSIVVNAFSRWREFRADAGSARLAGRDKMIAGLRKLQRTMDYVDTSDKAVATLKISNKPVGLLSKIFSTHPPLEERIARLERGNY